MNARILANLVTAVGLAVAVTGPANAIVNGGFDNGTFNGWTQFGNSFFDSVVCDPPLPPSFFTSPLCSAAFGPDFSFVPATGGITQDLDNAGKMFTIGFDLLAFGDNPSSFMATFGGTTLLNLANPNTGGVYQHFSFNVVAASNSVLRFEFRDDPGFIYLDTVTAQVPEPASLTLLGSGLIGLYFGRRRKNPR